jgi:energy-coupling factor transporter ATP-binding protein EcfA2
MRNFAPMKIAKIIIPNFQQFKGFELDLTYPEGHAKAGQPLEKVCFIGRNGTGKSTLLRFINGCLVGYPNYGLRDSSRESVPFIFKIVTGKEAKYVAVLRYLDKDIIRSPSRPLFLPHDVEEKPEVWSKLRECDPYPIDEQTKKWFEASNTSQYDTINSVIELTLSGDSKKMLIYSPAESGSNELLAVQDTPSTSVDDALKMFNKFPTVHKVSAENIRDFWRLLIFLIKKRESDLLAYQDRGENQEKTLKQVREEFNRQHPEILKGIADLWNQILENAGLEFNYQGAKIPVQLTDNLLAYIKLKSTGETVPYNALSTGIRNFIFRLGHIYALYFNRQIESGFLLIDEPENSLFPDFLYDLVDIYQSIIHNTQFFVATHSPIIAAQFEPEERFILDFNDEGFVTARRGVTAVGDDPNDMLVQDFGVRSLLGPKGMEKWERFIELKIRIKQTTDPAEKSRLLDEYVEIGNAYNFSTNEVSGQNL